MENSISTEILISSVVFKLIAMIVGVLGNITVIIYTIFRNKEKEPTSYLVANLALADLLVCLTFYPIWMTEFLQIILNIDSNQNLFCKLSRSSLHALLFASVATLLAITADKFVFIIKPLKYPLIVTKRMVFVVISGIWVTACCLFIVLLVYLRKNDAKFRSFCYLDCTLSLFKDAFVVYCPLTLIIILNVWILIVAEKQRKRILAETVTITNSSHVNRFFQARKAVKTFSIVVAVLTFCVMTPTVVGPVLREFSSASSKRLWFVVIHYEFYGVNSIVNAFIYGMRHVKYRKALGRILLRILRCNKLANR